MDVSAVDAAIGDRVHQEMWRSRVTQTELAAVLGFDQGALSRRLRGRTAWKVTELLIVAERLNVPLERLIPTQRMNSGEGKAAEQFRCTAPAWAQPTGREVTRVATLSRPVPLSAGAA